jgi:hypothetical protein
MGLKIYHSVSELKDKTILIASLNWGLGHVFRSAALVLSLAKQGNRIVIACSESQLPYFKSLVTDVHVIYVTIDDYPFVFGGKSNWLWDGMKSFFALRKHLRSEELSVLRLIAEHNIDVVLSDHRYGFWCATVPTIFITHQIKLPLPFFGIFVAWLHDFYLKRFTAVWIMDSETNALAGKLSRKRAPNQFYIGLWSCYHNQENLASNSNFANLKNIEIKCETTRVLIIVNGPSPYNLQLQEKAIQKYLGFEHVTIVSPIEITQCPEHWKFFKNPEFSVLNQLYTNADLIVSYCGYSSLMDAKLTGKAIDFSATPGQREQLYLMKHNKIQSVSLETII